VDECSYPVFSKGFCKSHQYKRTDKKKAKKISPYSEKHLEKLKEYRIVRDQYMKMHPKCECNGRIPGCTGLSEDLHHAKGRGQFLSDLRYFKALSRHCHVWVGENPLEAIGIGLLFKTGDL
jgi:hypothetical protein